MKTQIPARKKAKKDKVEWFNYPPDVPGFYWYYGHMCGQTDKAPELAPVQVVQVLDMKLTLMRSHLLSDYEPLDGIFCRAILPEAPMELFARVQKTKCKLPCCNWNKEP